MARADEERRSRPGTKPPRRSSTSCGRRPLAPDERRALRRPCVPSDIRNRVRTALERAERESDDADSRRLLRRRARVALARLAPAEVTCAMFTGQHVRVVLPEVVAADIYLHGLIEPSVSH